MKKEMHIGMEDILKRISYCEKKAEKWQEEKIGLMKSSLAKTLKKNFMNKIKNPDHRKFFNLTSLEYVFEKEKGPRDKSIMFNLCSEFRFVDKKTIEFNANLKQFYIRLDEMKQKGISSTKKSLAGLASEITKSGVGIKVTFCDIKDIKSGDIGEYACFYFDL